MRKRVLIALAMVGVILGGLVAGTAAASPSHLDLSPFHHHGHHQATTTTTVAPATTTTVAPTTTTQPSTPTTVPPTTTTTVPSTGTYSCQTTDYHGTCPASGSYSDPSIIANTSNPGSLTVSPNVWSPISGETVHLFANGPIGWYETTNVAKGNTSVTAFANVGMTYNEEPLSSFTSLTSSFNENQNPNASTDSWAAYDNWFNNYGNEVMIQHDFANGGNGSCGDTTGVYDVAFGGSNGVPVQDWQLCQFGSELIWQLSAPGTHNLMNEQSGSVDLLAMTEWLETHGYLPANSTITGLSYGWEIASTGGVNENYQLNDWTVTGTA
jgi:hypothetical protein